jgi:hypothetical protein
VTNENDPLDRLGETFRQVPIPDQWSEIVARNEDRATTGRRATTGSSRHTWWWLGAAAAAVVALVGGVALIRDRETNAPVATQPGDTVPAPAPVLPCANEADLADVVELLGSGTVNLDYGQHGALYLLGSGAHVVLVADVASVARVDEWRRLELTGTPTYFTGEGPVDAISERAPWDPAAGADPLVAPRHLDNVRVAAAVHSLSSAPVWSPGLGGLIVGCAGSDVPAIDMHSGGTLFGDPSIDEIAELMADPDAAPPVSSSPPTAPMSTDPAVVPALPCRTESELAAVVAVLTPGVGDLDYPSQMLPPASLIEGETVLVADIGSVSRVGDYARLEFVAAPTILRGGGPIDALSLRIPARDQLSAADRSGDPDPLGSPVRLEGVRVAAAVRSLSVAPVWAPEDFAFYVGCAGNDVPAIDIGNGAPLDGDPSIDELLAAVTSKLAPISSVPPTTPATSPSTSPTTTSPSSTPADAPAVSAHWGGSAQGQAGCSVSACRYLNAVGAGFAPGGTVTVSCWGDQGGEWSQFSMSVALTVAPDGTVSVIDMCYFGFEGSHAKVVIEGVESNVLTSGE